MMLTFDSDGRPKMWWGYADMGPIQIPPLPYYIILTDRADGKLWQLSFNVATASPDGFGYISINDALPTTPDKQVYPAFEEPFLSNSPRTRLIIRGGILGVEEKVANLNESQVNTSEAQRRAIARLALSRSYREIISSILTPGEYAWVPYTIVQTPNPS